ncbi:unnamed protein product [Phytophthora fragariaefolia]|uniref:Unnamed protein product n=1 Tax=Phytophthora fragariaefolia TaxID=1490495 RepID=A0A9W6TLE4_9STRA|nr:unnamed protein product [Phytophthora fragariaefolia]
MALTLHYVDENFPMCSWTLEVEPFPGKHTGVAIARCLEDMMDRWELRPEMCMLLVRDGAANAVLGSDILGINNMSCFAHSLHLVLGGTLARHKATAALVADADVVSGIDQDAEDRPGFVSAQTPDDGEVEQASELKQEASIAELEVFVGSSLAGSGHRLAPAQVRGIVQRFRSLATYFHKSAKATNGLEEIQVKEWKRAALHFITGCPTRWNSCKDMLARLIELEVPSDSFFTYFETTEGKKEFKDLDQEKYPKPNEWFEVKCLVALLDPIAAVTKVLSGCYYPTLALVMLRRIKKVLGDPAIFVKQAALVGRQEFQAYVLHVVHQAREAILEHFKQRFSGMDFDFVLISFLDPRFHKMKLLKQYEIDLAKQCLLDAAATAACNSPKLSSTTGHDYRSFPFYRSPSGDTESVWDDLLGSDCEDDSSPVSDDPNFQSVRLSCSNEFVAYLEAAKYVPKKQEDSLVWWSVNYQNYPSCALHARKWLGRVATSVPYERAFSTAGNAVAAKRCQMDVSLVRDLVFIAENYAGPMKEDDTANTKKTLNRPRPIK